MSVFNNMYRLIKDMNINDIYKRDVPYLISEFTGNSGIDVTGCKMIRSEIGMNVQVFIIFKPDFINTPSMIEMYTLSDTLRSIIFIIPDNLFDLEPRKIISNILSMYTIMCDYLFYGKTNDFIYASAFVLTIISLFDIADKYNIITSISEMFKENKSINRVIEKIYDYIYDTLKEDIFNPVTTETLISDLINCNGISKIINKEEIKNE